MKAFILAALLAASTAQARTVQDCETYATFAAVVTEAQLKGKPLATVKSNISSNIADAGGRAYFTELAGIVYQYHFQTPQAAELDVLTKCLKTVK